MKNTETRISAKSLASSIDTTNLFTCIVWGFPLTMAFIISSLISLGVSDSLGGGIFIQTVLLISIFMLMALIYASLFIWLPMVIYDYRQNHKTKYKEMDGYHSDTEPSLAEVEESVKDENEPPTLFANSQEQSYTKQCMESMRKTIESREYVSEIIMDYINHVMPPFLSREDFASVCNDIRLWIMNSSHLPNAVVVSEELTSLDIRHFIWNIAERICRQMGLSKSKNYEYDGESRIRFMTAMFPDLFKDMSRNTLKNFTHKPDFGNIRLDRLNRSDLCFHYEDQQSSTKIA